MRLRPRIAPTWVFLALFTGASPGTAAPTTEPEKVRVRYHAPPECPDEANFIAAIRERTAAELAAPTNDQAPVIDVTVTLTATESVARMEFADRRGKRVSRTVSGTTCTSVVSGIALVTALAIDSRLPEGSGGGEPVAEDASAVSTQPSPRATPTPSPSHLPGSEVPGARAAVSSSGKAPTRDWLAELGVLATMSSGIGPAAAIGARGLVGIEWPRGPEVRVGFDYGAVPATTLAVHGGVRVDMEEFAGRASGCPIAVPIGAVVRLLPCAGLASGVIHGETLPSSGVVARGAASPAFLALLAEARADARLGDVFVEVSGEVKFNVEHPVFALEPPNNARPALYMVPVVALGASLGLGLVL